jgi:transcriptional regulator with XRE-family HTH domain
MPLVCFVPLWHNCTMNLDQWMADNKWSDAKLAEAVGVSRPFITRIRHGKRQPSLPVAAKLSRVTDLPLEAFIRGEAA